MKQVDENQIDALLRRYSQRERERARERSRRESTSAEDSGAAMASAHLDADELNAYAERALPEAARRRYSAHLSDCDTCRRLVTELSLAQLGRGTETASSPGDLADGRRSWLSRISALFTLPVLQYGVPAMAVLGLVAFALFITRRPENRESFMASSHRPETSTASQEQENSAPSATTNATNSNMSAYAPLNSQEPAATRGKPATPPPGASPSMLDRPAPGTGASRGRDSSITANSNTTSTAVPETTLPMNGRDASRPAGTARDEEGKRVRKSEPGAGPPADAASSRQSYARNAPAQPPVSEDNKKAPANAPAVAKPQNNAGDVAQAETDQLASVNGERAGGAAAPATPAQPSARRGRRERRAATAPAKDKSSNSVSDDNSDATEVAGHRFLRKGGRWVDESFGDSMRVINVRRGSDRYQALASDEPGLFRIAEHFNGEVVIAWKGTAYRIY